VTLTRILAVNYYDNYNFTEITGIPQSLLSAQSALHITQGMLTGSLNARLSSDSDSDNVQPVTSVFYYDRRGNIVRSVSSNPLGGYDVEETEYNFTNQVVSRTVTHDADKPLKKITESYAYTYDHAGRAMKTAHSVNGSTEVTLADNVYDALGRLTAMNRSGNGALATTYTYNVRSWMTGLTNSHFSENLYYTDNPYNTGNRHYGGNISAVGWKAGQTQRAYDLSYDNLSRLTAAKYYESNANDRYTTQYSYDSMGNILTLKRNGLQDGGTYGLIDNLTYSYNGNQLTKISDSVEDPSYVGAFNFKDGADSSAEYTYDANGNMTADKNKGISSITYNTINLPQKITFSDGRTTEYVYSYDGTKLQTKHTTPVPQTSTTTTYSGNLIYENGALKRLLVDGGYVTFNGTTPKYHFYIQDHLGNNRVVADEGGNIEQINHYYPYGGLMADISTNSDAQPHKYNGKELDRMHGLDMYDYGARYYDAAIGRWPTMDALAEKNPEISPYAYCIDNPVNAFDPDGRKIVFVNGYLGFGSPKGGSTYWNGENSLFVKGAQNTFKDFSSPFFTNYDYKYLESASAMREILGYNYAKENYEKITDGMTMGVDHFNFVSHSMGGAFSEGIMKYLSEQGWQIDNALYLNAWEPTQIINKVELKRIDATFTNDPVQILSVPILQEPDIPNSDIKIRKKSEEDIQYIHRDFIDDKNNIWTEYNW